MDHGLEHLLTRMRETGLTPDSLTLDDTEKEALSDLWDSLTTPIMRAYAEYPQADGTYEQEPTNTLFREWSESGYWICSDEMDGLSILTRAAVERMTLLPDED